MHYTISYDNPASQFVNFELIIDAVSEKKLHLQLPAWRPGRYTLQNFAKNIHSFQASDLDGKPLRCVKETKDCWVVDTKKVNGVRINYTYYASQMDAGGSWLDQDQLYLNFITCGLLVVGREQEPYEISFLLPKDYEVATSLTNKKGIYRAKNFYELVDSPIIASDQLQHQSYEVGACKFHLWFMGDCQPDWDKLIMDFTAFTQAQIESFGSFPTKEYHFMFQILPYRHYHGVEHQHSTVIVLGPSEQFHSDTMYQNILGISSHELYHTWNVTRLRAKEMVPYQYEKENYSRAGFILEGITTYFGDLMLRRGGTWDDKRYLVELNSLLKRHYLNIGRSNYSLADSSFDLWLDGYTADEPRRVSSIYVKGALIAFILDITIRKQTSNQFGLDELMRKMWLKFGQNESGYCIDDYVLAAEKIIGKSLKDYFNDFVFGTKPLEKALARALNYVGYQLKAVEAAKANEAYYGFRVRKDHGKLLVHAIMPSSPAHEALCLQDELVAINQHKVSFENIDLLCRQTDQLSISVFRKNKLKHFTLARTESIYWTSYEALPAKKATKKQQRNRQLWMTQSL